MLRYVILAVMCSVGIKDCDVQTNSSAQTLKLRNITEYLLQNPSVKLLEQTERNLGAEMRYIMGARISGDRLVSSADGGQIFHAVRDLTVTLDYPPNGSADGATVTYVEILVQQSSNLGRAYITGGGIGQRSISIAIDIYDTTYFKADVNIYGY